MALKNDSFFSLSKSERRATLVLVAVLILLLGARVVQHIYHTKQSVETTTEYDSFKTELEEFGRSLRPVEKKGGESQSRPVKKQQQPKELKEVPREE